MNTSPSWHFPITGTVYPRIYTFNWHILDLPSKGGIHPESIFLYKEHLVCKVYLLAGVFPLVSFLLHCIFLLLLFFLKVLFGSQIAETACDKASTSD